MTGMFQRYSTEPLAPPTHSLKSTHIFLFYLDFIPNTYIYSNMAVMAEHRILFIRIIWNEASGMMNWFCQEKKAPKIGIKFCLLAHSVCKLSYSYN